MMCCEIQRNNTFYCKKNEQQCQTGIQQAQPHTDVLPSVIVNNHSEEQQNKQQNNQQIIDIRYNYFTKQYEFYNKLMQIHQQNASFIKYLDSPKYDYEHRIFENKNYKKQIVTDLKFYPTNT